MKNESSVNRTIARLMLWAAAVLVVSTLQTNAHAQKLTSYSDSSGKNVIFQGNDFHVHDLFRAAGSICDVATSWSNGDMKVTTGTVAGNFNNFTRFSKAVGQHVFFVDGNQHLHQFLKGSSGIWGNPDPSVPTYGGISAYSANVFSATVPPAFRAPTRVKKNLFLRRVIHFRPEMHIYS